MLGVFMSYQLFVALPKPPGVEEVFAVAAELQIAFVLHCLHLHAMTWWDLFTWVGLGLHTDFGVWTTHYLYLHPFQIASW